MSLPRGWSWFEVWMVKITVLVVMAQVGFDKEKVLRGCQVV